MDEEIGNVEYRVAIFQADIDFHFSAVLGVYDADQSERNAGPLVLLDAAVVMGAEVYDAFLFMDRVCLEVQTRGVDVGADDLDAFMDRFFTDDGQDDGLILLVPVYFVACFQGFHIIDRFKAFCFCLTDDFFGCQSFCSGCIKECFVLFAIVHDGFAFGFVHALPYGLGSAVCFFHVIPPNRELLSHFLL